MLDSGPAFYIVAQREWWIIKTNNGFTTICKHILKNLLQNWNLLIRQTTSKQEASHVYTDLRFPVPVQADICLYAVHRRALVCLLTRGVPHLKLNLQFSLREGQRSRLQMFSYGVSLEVSMVERGGGGIEGRYALLSTCTGRCIVSDPPPPLHRTLWIEGCIPLIRQFISTSKRHKLGAINGFLTTLKR